MLYSKIPKQHPAKAARQSLHTRRETTLSVLSAAQIRGETASALPGALEAGSAERPVWRQVTARGEEEDQF